VKGWDEGFHGAAYWYYRHEWMNANLFHNRQGLLPTPRRVQTPASICGPVYIRAIQFGQEQAVLLASQEIIASGGAGYPQSHGATAAEIQGDFSRSVDSSGRAVRSTTR